MYIMWTLAAMIGAGITNRKAFREFIQVRRHMEFRKRFPNHLVTLMQTEKLVAGEYAEKKRKAKIALQGIGLAAIWPLTIPFMIGMLSAEGIKLGYRKLAGINDNMAPKITIDHYKIREEEGR